MRDRCERCGENVVRFPGVIVQAVRSGQLEIVPEYHKSVWYHWLENIKDWCISRQLWWGHRIPAYKVTITTANLTTGETTEEPIETDDSFWIAARNEEEAHAKIKSRLNHSHYTLVQDEDVLDTWFSSALFPLSVFGWPNNTLDLKAFFPTTLLETGKIEE